MKSTFHSIVSPFLALLVLLSTISWTIDKHLCMGRVMDIAFFHHADNCGMEDAMAMMDGKMEDKHCCDDQSFTIEGQDDLKHTWDELDLDSQEFPLTFAHTYFPLASIPVRDEIQPEVYPPPLLVQDLTILHEVFLI